MPPRSAEQVADGLWRRLRPLFVDLIGAAMTDQEPPGDEDSYITERAARQIDRYLARQQRPRTE